MSRLRLIITNIWIHQFFGRLIKIGVNMTCANQHMPKMSMFTM